MVLSVRNRRPIIRQNHAICDVQIGDDVQAGRPEANGGVVGANGVDAGERNHGIERKILVKVSCSIHLQVGNVTWVNFSNPIINISISVKACQCILLSHRSNNPTKWTQG